MENEQKREIAQTLLNKAKDMRHRMNDCDGDLSVLRIVMPRGKYSAELEDESITNYWIGILDYFQAASEFFLDLGYVEQARKAFHEGAECSIYGRQRIYEDNPKRIKVVKEYLSFGERNFNLQDAWNGKEDILIEAQLKNDLLDLVNDLDGLF